MRRSITHDGPRVIPRAGVTGVRVEPIAATHSFEAPRAGAKRSRGGRLDQSAMPAQTEAPTRRGGPRPITETSIKAITGDYKKADDNETAHRATARRITERMPSFEVVAADPHPAGSTHSRARKTAQSRETATELPAAASPSPGTAALRSERRVWLQGALTGALVLTLAWLASLIARAG